MQRGTYKILIMISSRNKTQIPNHYKFLAIPSILDRFSFLLQNLYNEVCYILLAFYPWMCCFYDCELLYVTWFYRIFGQLYLFFGPVCMYVCLSFQYFIQKSNNNADNGLSTLSDDYLTIYAVCSCFNGDYRIWIQSIKSFLTGLVESSAN